MPVQHVLLSVWIVDIVDLEVIEVDEHDEGNLKLAAAGKQHKY